MAPLKLPSRDAIEQAAKDQVQTVQYADPVTGERFAPIEPPAVNDPAGDADAEA